ncbi:MAG: sugar phosphate isomerase/epimerase [Tannerella sp.]|jgi:sugar phosphate isomerase/epimerase|nr:sugar phosphate isomerase/epimerase [Tannerella sp.]
MNRRNFISKSMVALTACGYSGLIPAIAAKSTQPGVATAEALAKDSKKNNRIGIQLYSVREELPKDFKGTLKKLADVGSKMGYKFAEAYGYDGKFIGKTLKETSEALSEVGMKLSGTHCGSGLLPADVKASEWDYWRKGADEMKEAGGRHLVQSWLPAKNLDELKQLTEQFNKIGTICKQGGVKFGYHNHHAEMKEMDGHVILDFLVKNTDPELVFFQMDLGHTLNGGGDILGYMSKYPHRFLSWHASDFKREQGYCEVGQGDVPYEKLLEIAESYGLEDLTVEQETGGDIFASCRNDFNYLIKFDWTWKKKS